MKKYNYVVSALFFKNGSVVTIEQSWQFKYKIDSFEKYLEMKEIVKTHIVEDQELDENMKLTITGFTLLGEVEQ